MAATTVAMVLTLGTQAVCALAQTAAPFPEVPIPHVATHSHRAAYATMLVGAGLIVASFPLEDRANRDYARYLAATYPDQITQLYTRTRQDDNLSTTTLLGGETLIGIGLYLRFFSHPAQDRLSLAWRGDACAISFRF